MPSGPADRNHMQQPKASRHQLLLHQSLHNCSELGSLLHSVQHWPATLQMGRQCSLPPRCCPILCQDQRSCSENMLKHVWLPGCASCFASDPAGRAG